MGIIKRVNVIARPRDVVMTQKYRSLLVGIDDPVDSAIWVAKALFNG